MNPKARKAVYDARLASFDLGLICQVEMQRGRHPRRSFVWYVETPRLF
jgi:hypothetical protein